MAITLTTKVAKIVKQSSGKGTSVFNDKLVDGARSLKVWGWQRGEYTQAKLLLEQAGCQAEIVEFVAHRWGGMKKQLRLHVVEPA